jgi:hypothetical protein
MYLEKFHAHICIRSKSKSPWSETPRLTFQELSSARYVLFNKEREKLTYPLRLDVFKSRVDIWLTDFYQYLRDEYPSIQIVSNGNHGGHHVLIHDEFDIIKFLLLYND